MPNERLRRRDAPAPCASNADSRAPASSRWKEAAGVAQRVDDHRVAFQLQAADQRQAVLGGVRCPAPDSACVDRRPWRTADDVVVDRRTLAPQCTLPVPCLRQSRMIGARLSRARRSASSPDRGRGTDAGTPPSPHASPRTLPQDLGVLPPAVSPAVCASRSPPRRDKRRRRLPALPRTRTSDGTRSPCSPESSTASWSRSARTPCARRASDQSPPDRIAVQTAPRIDGLEWSSYSTSASASAVRSKMHQLTGFSPL